MHLEKWEQVIETNFIDNFQKKQYWGLMQLFITNVLFAHVSSTILLSLVYFDSGSNWMTKYNISDEIWLYKYLYGYYWSCTILYTVGFGDISISNPIEAGVVSAVMLIGCLILSYNISQVGTFLNNLKQADYQVKNDLAVLNRMANMSQMS